MSLIETVKLQKFLSASEQSFNVFTYCICQYNAAQRAILPSYHTNKYKNIFVNNYCVIC